ncbi:NYN domain-containing protein [Nocardioides speluncae]|uniref:NYN domain-containing protein n=1 Tax=Nocardioides speluncae TaxID=2670337 RepID=UPI001982625A|nr:NYN domain-containing protein [Nocardioides speluncae]
MATRVAGTSLRSSIHVEYRALIESLIAAAEERSGLPLLRVHWYDSARDAVPDPQQVRIGELRKVKLRLGRFGREGQQKGVDLRIGLDLVAHARNSAADVFFLVSGDDDLTEAVEEAQGHGVEVIVLAVPDGDDKPHGVSRHLLRAADDLDLLAGPVVDAAVIRVEVPPKPEPATPAPMTPPKPAPATEGNVSPRPTPSDLAAAARRIPTPPAAALAYQGSTGVPSRVMPGYDDPADYDNQIDAVVTKVVSAFRQSATAEEMAELLSSKPSVPRDLDRALLVDLSDALDMYDLTDPIRHRLRERFWLQCV